MNKVILMGRLTRDPNISYSSGERQTTVARYTLAVDRRRRSDGGEQTADFISCVTFKKRAEFLEKYCHKGTKVLVKGRWQTGDYLNKDGVKIYTNECVIENIEFGESSRKEENETKEKEPE